MKHRLRHGHCDTTWTLRHYWCKKYRTPTLLDIYKIFKLRIKIYTCASKLNKFSLKNVLREYMIVYLTFIHPYTIEKLKIM
jgi:hypothetical protein